MFTSNGAAYSTSEDGGKRNMALRTYIKELIEVHPKRFIESC